MQPIDQAPIRICDFKKTNRQKYQERRDRNQASDERPAIICGLRSLASDFWIRPIFPAQPKEKEREKWNEPAITVLLVDGPFAAQLPEKDKPKRRQGDETRDRAGRPVLEGRALSRPGVMPLVNNSLHEWTSYQIRA